MGTVTQRAEAKLSFLLFLVKKESIYMSIIPPPVPRKPFTHPARKEKRAKEGIFNDRILLSIHSPKKFFTFAKNLLFF